MTAIENIKAIIEICDGTRGPRSYDGPFAEIEAIAKEALADLRDARRNARLREALEKMIDMVKRSNAGFPLDYEIRVAIEEYAENALEGHKALTGKEEY